MTKLQSLMCADTINLHKEKTVFYKIKTYQTLFINIFKMPIKQNSLQQTVEAQISRQKTSINKYVVFYQITNQTLL